MFLVCSLALMSVFSSEKLQQVLQIYKTLTPEAREILALSRVATVLKRLEFRPNANERLRRFFDMIYEEDVDVGGIERPLQTQELKNLETRMKLFNFDMIPGGERDYFMDECDSPANGLPLWQIFHVQNRRICRFINKCMEDGAICKEHFGLLKKYWVLMEGDRKYDSVMRGLDCYNDWKGSEDDQPMKSWCEFPPLLSIQDMNTALHTVRKASPLFLKDLDLHRVLRLLRPLTEKADEDQSISQNK